MRPGSGQSQGCLYWGIFRKAAPTSLILDNSDIVSTIVRTAGRGSELV